MKTVSHIDKDAEIEKIAQEINADSALGFALLWVLDDGLENTNAITAVKNALTELTAYQKVAEAAKPFSEKDECEYGFLISEDSDHSYPCLECEQVLALRQAIAELEATK